MDNEGGAPVDAKATLGILTQYKTSSSTDAKVSEADVLLLLTTEHNLENDDEDPWPGNAAVQGICTGQSVAVATDDGATFLAVHQVALELSLLLGATIDRSNGLIGCRKEDDHLLSHKFGGSKYYLSRCSESAMLSYIQQNQYV
ncbi:unnamed protein product [Ixodes hexagonus]